VVIDGPQQVVRRDAILKVEAVEQPILPTSLLPHHLATSALNAVSIFYR
jgi:hypothetical protein